MYDLIYNLVKSKDLLEANSLLKMIDRTLTNEDVNRPDYCKKLSQAIMQWAVMWIEGSIFTGVRSKYRIFPANRAIPYYLASFGLAVGKVRDTRKNIAKLIADIDKTIIEPSGISLSAEDEEEILSVLSTKFPFWEIVSPNSPLDILNINNSHRLFNSMCGASGDASSFVVYMFNMKDDTAAPEYVFLHELGHALQIALTGSDSLVPTEFIEFNNTLPDVRMEQGDRGVPELFADTFAIAVMRGTDLWHYSPFPFSDALNELFEKFFTALFEKYRASQR